jgi:hypothetical protein
VRRLAVFGAVLASALVAPLGASAQPPTPPLPCSYWIHGCNVLEYVCDAGVCVGPITAGIPAAKL